jgi:hypothetical protein
MSSLDCNEDLGFQRRFWRIQRAAWGLGALALLAAAFGVMGNGGVFARATVELSPGVTLRYDRFARQEAPTRLELLSTPSDGFFLEIRLSHEYPEHVRIIRVQPEAEFVSSDGRGWTFRFRGTPRVVKIDGVPEGPGIVRGRVDITGAGGAGFSTRVLP